MPLPGLFVNDYDILTGTANSEGWAVLRAFYGKHRVTVNGKQEIVELTRAAGAKALEVR